MNHQVIKVQSYLIKEAQTGDKIPVVNDVHLHSLYNPQVEAEKSMQKYDPILQKNQAILVLGLGFAYHIKEIIKKIESYHGQNYSLCVIEPNKEVYTDCLNHAFKETSLDKILFMVDFTVEELYKNQDFITFLTKRPGVIYHGPSFNLYSDYFKEVIQYHGPQELKYLKNNLQQYAKLNQYFDRYPGKEDLTFNQFIDYLKKEKDILDRCEDFLLLAYNEI